MTELTVSRQQGLLSESLQQIQRERDDAVAQNQQLLTERRTLRSDLAILEQRRNDALNERHDMQILSGDIRRERDEATRRVEELQGVMAARALAADPDPIDVPRVTSQRHRTQPPSTTVAGDCCW
jgi:hypothetical protein